jgi:transcriptional regulator with XRE-family HTH domain
MEAKDSVDVLVRRRLRELRIQRGLTLEDVAHEARIDVSTLSRLESGKRRLALDHLPRLAAALSVSTDELVREPAAEDPRVHGSSHTATA